MSGRHEHPVRRLTGGVDRRLAIPGGIALAIFAVLGVVVTIAPGPLPFDRSIALSIQSVHWHGFDPFNAFVSSLGDIRGIAVGVSLIIVVFILRRAAMPLVVVSGLYALVYSGVQALVRRPRPTGLPNVVTHIGAHSFPSGHVAMFSWIAIIAVLLMARGLPRVWYVTACVAATVVVILAALSRIDVGAHWPSDVVAGILLGTGWTAVSLSFHRLSDPALGRVPRRG